MLDSWIEKIKKCGANEAKIINPKELICAQRVRLKCQYGCSSYNTNYCCPPETPELATSEKIFHEYGQGILIEFAPPAHSGITEYIKYNNFITTTTSNLEKELFLEGYQFVFSLNSGPCCLCAEIKNNVFRNYRCRKNRSKFSLWTERIKGVWKFRNYIGKDLSHSMFQKIYSHIPLVQSCKYPNLARPAMEAMGIDVFASVKKFGFNVAICPDAHSLPHYYSLILIQ